MRRVLFLSLLLLLAVPAVRAEKTLHWTALDVRANLESDGRLQIVERHTMLFTGDWNGGERVFRVEPSQQLSIDGMTRIDPDGTRHDMPQGGLASVDDWQLEDKRLRWRAREVNDPPFQSASLIYEIRYSLDEVLVPTFTDGQYKLAHDFAFPNRTGAIEKFDVELTFAPEWKREPIRSSVANLAPGKSHVILTTLQYAGEGVLTEGAWYRPYLELLRPWIILIPAALVLLVFLLRSFRPTVEAKADTQPIDRAWLDRNVFVYAPEVAGALLDGKVGPPEVAAMLAAMERDGKISSRVVEKKGQKTSLQLELTGDETAFAPREKTLVALLFGSSREVNTRELRASKQKVGFDPAGAIEKSVAAEAQRIAPGSMPHVSFGPTGMMLVAALALIVIGAAGRKAEVFAGLVAVVGGFLILIPGFKVAKAWREDRDVFTAIGLLVPAAIFWTGAYAMQWLLRRQDGQPFTFWALAGLALCLGGIYRTILQVARDGEGISPKAAAIRQNLQWAHAWFASELGKPAPAIDDAWTPWLIALGLDEKISSWWKAHAGPKAAVRTERSDDDEGWASSSSSPSSSAATSSAFSGRGGGFGGAGATASWVGAATALAAPISAPRSSSGSSSSSSSSDSSWSSSDSSSSSSSGGGGGGGW